MTNVAAVQAAIEALLDLHGAAFRGEIVVVENTHFRFPDRAEGDPDAGLTRAWTHPSRWNVDVPGMTRLLDLREHFRRRGAPVSFVGLVDAGPSALASSPWHDPEHVHGEYGGDGRGPLRPGDLRDGYHWALDDLHRARRSWVAEARVPLSWPRFTSPATGRVLDLRGGVLRRDGGRLVADDRRLRLLTMTTANEHGATGITGACKSAMGLVDMSAGALGTHPLVAGLQSVHYAGRLPGQPGERSPLWRMAGPLARFGQRVRRPDLYLTVAEWVAVTPATGFDARAEDLRHSPACAVRAGTVIAGDDPVAIDAWAVRHLLHPAAGAHAAALDLDDADSTVSRFLRCFRLEAGHGTLDPALVEVA
jgi:hypothetical protein